MSSQANTILNTLKTELLSNIQVSNGYNTNLADCKRGAYQLDEMLNRPAIAFWCHHNSVDEYLTNNTLVKRLDIYLYMYVDSVDGLHDLMEDVEDFLYKDFTYKTKTTIKNAPIYEAGISFPTSLTELEIEIKFVRRLT